jgi:mannose/cellobiose epimerase-like protein (N-acyl-D-glucosamine 2-epimerase family)
MRARGLLLAVALLLPFPAAAEEVAAGVRDLPTGEEWLAHFVRDLLPYWSSPEALGDPVGLYPTFRYPDGEPIDADELLRSEYRGMAEHSAWIALRLDRTYTRMISRQAFVLGVAYHLTGDGRYLAWARAGVDRILDDLADAPGSFCSWIERGECRPEPPRRTAQDLAYAMLGPALYAYLTRDAEIIDRLVETRRQFFAAYRDEESGLLRWVLEASEDPPDRHAPDQLELVAQLDQINAYMLLLAPLVQGAEGERWRADLAALAGVLLERFYDPQRNVFWGRIDAPEYRRFAGHHHTDTGHTGKALWMLARVARLLGEERMEGLARQGGLRLVREAFRPVEGWWAGGWKADGSLGEGAAMWWAYAELDQLAAALALEDPSAARHLGRAYDFWFGHFVDHRHAGTWPFAVPPGEQPPLLKAFLWKNGYHSAEHALVGLITANALRRQPVSLFFAAPAGSTPAPLRPYLFDGEAEIVGRLPLPQLPGHERLRVRFSRVR